MRNNKLIQMFWQFPQILLGIFLYILLCLFKKVTKVRKEKEHFIVYNKALINLSLGSIVFVSNSSEKTLKHELGHSKQSMILGWFYLPVIGIPSFLHAVLCRLGILGKRKYYSFYTEKWADRLGGVVE